MLKDVKRDLKKKKKKEQYVMFSSEKNPDWKDIKLICYSNIIWTKIPIGQIRQTVSKGGIHEEPKQYWKK